MVTETIVNQVIGDIKAYMRIHGGSYRDWYVGIASNPRQRLLLGHNVREYSDSCTYKDCGNETLARDVENHFIRRGCDGGPGGGDHTTTWVYAYRVATHTRQE